MLLLCSENCSIAYHPTCWRRFKNESIINSDRDFLLTPCPTPDCFGHVRSISVFDLKGKCKIKFTPPTNKALLNGTDPQPPSKRMIKKKDKSSKSERLSRKKGTGDNDSVQDDQVKKTSSESSLEVCVVRDRPSVGGESPSPTVEDSRKLEDTVEIINRQAEAELEENKVDSIFRHSIFRTYLQENVRVKPKKRKEKKVLTELGFAFTERPSARNDTSPEEENKRSGYLGLTYSTVVFSIFFDCS